MPIGVQHWTHENRIRVNDYSGNMFGHKKIAEPKFRDICDPNGIRTRVAAVRGRSTRPLYDGAVC